jgi:nitrilase
MEKVTAAAVQATPVFLDREATVDKACRLIEEAAAAGAGLVVFPETFVPTYPDWVWRSPPWRTAGEWFGRLLDQAVVVPSPATEAIGAPARQAGVWVSIGVNERDPAGSTLYNAQLYLGPDGAVTAKHRKLMPTGGERLVWGMGDGSTLAVVDTPFGRLGGLTCWENYMPLARYAMYAKGVDVWAAPTWDTSDVWVPTLRHLAKEGRMYVIGVAPLLRGSDVPPTCPAATSCTAGRRTGSAAACPPSSGRAARSWPARWSSRRASSTPSWTRPGPARPGWSSTRSATTPGRTCSGCWSTPASR